MYRLANLTQDACEDFLSLVFSLRNELREELSLVTQHFLKDNQALVHQMDRALEVFEMRALEYAEALEYVCHEMGERKYPATVIEGLLSRESKIRSLIKGLKDAGARYSYDEYAELQEGKSEDLSMMSHMAEMLESTLAEALDRLREYQAE